ncbi:MAG: hypothetical protein AB7K68_15875 [Bacteriovoracia bacterium]
MKYLICLLAGLLSTQAPASACEEGTEIRVSIRAELGCPSGLVLQNVETVCVDAASPVFASLQANQEYDACLESRLDPSGKFYQAHIFRAKKTNFLRTP